MYIHSHQNQREILIVTWMFRNMMYETQLGMLKPLQSRLVHRIVVPCTWHQTAAAVRRQRLCHPPLAVAPNFDTPVGKRERKRQPADTGAAAPNLSKEQRLAKVLAAAGVASRRKCEELIDEGRVAVNGQVVSVQGFKVIPTKDKITVDAKVVRLALAPARGGAGGTYTGKGGPASHSGAAAAGQPLLHYFAVHKPIGFICSNVSTKPGKRVVDLLEGWAQQWLRKQKDKALLPPRLFTAGRLDVGTSGLVLVTNDGVWSNRAIHPSAGLTKEYLAVVAEPPIEQQLEALRRGAEVEGVLCVPKLVDRWQGRGPPSGRRGGGGGHVVRIVVSEGKKHEVRILVASAGMELTALHRTRVGGYTLPPDIPPGGFVELKPDHAEAVLRDGFSGK